MFLVLKIYNSKTTNAKKKKITTVIFRNFSLFIGINNKQMGENCFFHDSCPLKQKQPPEVFCEKRCSQKFRKIHRKTPVSPVPQACNFIKKETLAQVFSCEFCEIFKNTIFTEHLRTTASVKTKINIFG